MSPTEFQFPLFPKKVWTVAGLVVVLLGISFAGYRAVRKYSPPVRDFDFDRSGMSDFHSMRTYASAFGDGVNPYAAEVVETYIVSRSAPPFSPLEFFLHWPFAKMPLPTADIAFFASQVVMLGLLAWLTLLAARIRFDATLWLWVLGAILFSRAGHITLFTGYFTAQLVVGAIIALHWSKTRPTLAALGFLLASGKPTWVIPLTIVMLCRRDFKAVIIGLLLTAIVAGAGLGWLASFSSFGDVVEGIVAGQQAFDDDPTEFPINTWTRIDILGMIAKAADWIPGNGIYLAAMAVLLVVPGWAVYRASNRESDPGAAGLSAIIAALALLVTLYHHSYDCLLIVPAWLALALNGRQICPSFSPAVRWAVVSLLTVPAINYVATQSFRNKMGLDQYSFEWQSITMINGICLTAALLIAIVAAFRVANQGHALAAEKTT